MGLGPRAKRNAAVGAVAAGGLAVWGLASTGALSLNLGWGRSRRALGPQELVIAAPRTVVFDVIAEPYLHRTARALSAKLRVLERGTDMVLAAHFTPLPLGLQATTVETVRFDRPERVSFRLVRGPVPEVEETFELHETDDDRTRLVYRGELSADLWGLGRLWGRAVARTWERTVATSLDGVRVEAERLGSRAQ
ncbi:MAG TPA: SRPBCC family protein [Acidimicrobiales bacterium]